MLCVLVLLLQCWWQQLLSGIGQTLVLCWAHTLAIDLLWLLLLGGWLLMFLLLQLKLMVVGNHRGFLHDDVIACRVSSNSSSSGGGALIAACWEGPLNPFALLLRHLVLPRQQTPILMVCCCCCWRPLLARL